MLVIYSDDGIYDVYIIYIVYMIYSDMMMVQRLGNKVTNYNRMYIIMYNIYGVVWWWQ